MHIDDFKKEMQVNLDAFIIDYRKNHKNNPEQYPLDIPSNNDGLWLEFFIDFYTSE